MGHISGFRKNDKGEAIEVVPILTVDQLVKRDNIKHIDILKIDTEGYDTFVLDGASNSLSKGLIDFIIFEYNTFWPSDQRNEPTQLEKTVLNLYDKGKYVCYLSGKAVLQRLTFCYDKTVGKRQWSNVFCASSTSKVGQGIIQVFDSNSLAFQAPP